MMQKFANTHRTPSLWTGRARTPCVSWGRRPSADPAGGQKGRRGGAGREEEMSIDFYLFLVPVLVDMDTVMTAKRNKKRLLVPGFTEAHFLPVIFRGS